VCFDGGEFSQKLEKGTEWYYFQEVRISKADNGMRGKDRSKYHRAERRKAHKNGKPGGTHIPATFFMSATFCEVVIGGLGFFESTGSQVSGPGA
jgi:hypothetical protein